MINSPIINPLTAREYGANKARRNRIKMATATIAAVATTLVLAKKGKLNPVEGGNKYIESFKALLKKPADKVLNIFEGSKVIAKFTEGLGKIKTKLAPSVENFSKKANGIKDEVVAKAKNSKEGFLADVETMAAKAKGRIKGFAQKDSTKKAAEFVKDIPAKTKDVFGTLKSKLATAVDKIVKKNIA